jgi:hypothetical protein
MAGDEVIVWEKEEANSICASSSLLVCSFGDFAGFGGSSRNRRKFDRPES